MQRRLGWLMSDGSLRTYLKMHLGTSEARYVSAGMMPMTLDLGEQLVGLAICADTSRPSHLETYVGLGATTYAAGVFLNDEWYATDSSRFPAYAERYRVLALMANHGASTGTLVSVGKSAAWAPGGQLLAQASGTETCLVAATFSDGVWTGRLISM